MAMSRSSLGRNRENGYGLLRCINDTRLKRKPCGMSQLSVSTSGTATALLPKLIIGRGRHGAKPVILSLMRKTKMLKYARKQVASLVKNEEGAALIEYGMLVGLIAVGCVAAVTTLGTTIAGYFTAINAQL